MRRIVGLQRCQRHHGFDAPVVFVLLLQHRVPHHAEFDAGLRWVDTLHTNNGATPGTVPAYFELDSRLGWHASERLELSLVGQNLLHAHHPEYGFPDPTRVEIERSVYGKFVWRY